MRAERRASPGRDPLARVLRRSRAAMALESFTRAFWPLGSAARVRLGGAGVRAGRGHHPAAADGGDRRWRGSSLLGLLILGLRRFRWPSVAEARARIDATLPGTAARGARATRRRSGATIRRRRRSGRRTWRGCAGSRPRPGRCVADLGCAAHDPWALRLVALVALIAAGLFARDRGVEAVVGGAGAGPGHRGGGGAELRGLGRAAGLYRAADPLPAGGAGRRAGGGARGHEGDDPGLRRARALRDRGERVGRDAGGAGRGGAGDRRGGVPGGGERGRSRCSRAGREIGAWSFTMEPDLPPEISLAGAVGRGADRRDAAALRGAGRPRHHRGRGRDRARPRARSTAATASRSSPWRGRRSSPTCRCR